MKAVIQRVRDASVKVDDKKTGSIDWGLLVYLGVAGEDSEKDSEWMAEKTLNLRIFNDEGGKMNLSLIDIVNGDKKKEITIGVLAISQFTLLADAVKGRRPFYGAAAEPLKAKNLYENFIMKIRERGIVCEAGIFQAHMDVRYTNDGPVTILLDSLARA